MKALRQATGTSFLIVSTGLYFSTFANATERSDLQQVWQKVACSGSIPDRPTRLWNDGVFDAQVEGRFFEPIAGKKVQTQTIARKALAMSKALHHRGHTFGLCKNGDAWTLSTPAGSPLVKNQVGYRLPKTELDEACARWTVSFAAAKGGQVQDLTTETSINTSSLSDGVLSIECKPKRPRWLGKQVWYLAPVGKGPPPDLAHAQFLHTGDPDSGILAWINAMRHDAGLRPVLRRDEVNKAASVLAISQHINHDRSLLQQLTVKLDAERIQLLGENRVAAADMADAAWLLWNSPSHRRLLLHPEASYIGTALIDRDPDVFAVITFARSTTLNTAKTESSKAQKHN